MTQNKRILIPNATSPQNIGDAAILEGLLSLIRRTYPNADIVIHSSEPERHDLDNIPVRQTIYSWAVFAQPAVLARLWRVGWLVIAAIAHRWQQEQRLPLPTELRQLCKDYREADIVICVGGGALRSQPGFTQTLNFLMTGLIFWWGTRTNAKTIVAPVSFGPFAARWQEKMMASILSGTHLVTVREEISFQKLKPYIPHLVLSQDHALLLPARTRETNTRASLNKPFILGFTIRNWLTTEKQQFFEAAFLQALTEFAAHHPHIVFQPIVQVTAPEYGDYDLEITRTMARLLKKDSLTVLPVVQNKDVWHAQKIYSELSLLLGMRMHSNILAATVGVPFVAVSYEHKTEGIAQALGLEEYCLRVEDVHSQNLLQLLNTARRGHLYMRKTMTKNLKKIQRTEHQRWHQILQSYA